MNRCLIAYYSLTGVTAKVALAIASRLPSDLEPIQDAKPRRGAGGHFRSVFEAVFKTTPGIAPASKKVADYDVVILGCPVWAQNMASPMRTYIRREGARIKRLGLFCTEIGSGGEAVVRQMAALTGRESVADLVLADKDLKSDNLDALIDRFAQQIQAQTDGARQARSSAV
jgi:flavodoxin